MATSRLSVTAVSKSGVGHSVLPDRSGASRVNPKTVGFRVVGVDCKNHCPLARSVAGLRTNKTRGSRFGW